MIPYILLLLLEETLLENYIVAILCRTETICMRLVAFSQMLKPSQIISYIIWQSIATLENLDVTFCCFHSAEVEIIYFVN